MFDKFPHILVLVYQIWLLLLLITVYYVVFKAFCLFDLLVCEQSDFLVCFCVQDSTTLAQFCDMLMHQGVERADAIKVGGGEKNLAFIMVIV